MANITEVFPVNKGSIETKIDLLDSNTVVKVLGSDLIIESPDETLVIPYGAVFISLGNTASIKDGTGAEISLDELLYSSKTQYKKSVTNEIETEYDELLLVKEKNDDLIGQETTAEQEEITAEKFAKFGPQEIEEIIDAAITEVKNAKEESKNDNEKLATAKSIDDQIKEAIADGGKQGDYNEKPIDVNPYTEQKNDDPNPPVQQLNPETETSPALDSNKPTIELQAADNSAPANPIASSDSGKSATDNITNVTTPTLTGTAGAGETITIFNGTTALGTTVTDASGNWTFTTTGVLTDGNYSFTVTASGSQNPSEALAVTIDTATTAVTIDLLNTSDSGALDTDNNTSDNTPTLVGTSEANADIVVKNGAIIIGTTTADASGNWTLTTSALGDGVHTITAEVTDIAGNTATSTALTLTIDTDNPIAVATIDLVSSSDSGVSSIDNITNDNTPELTGNTEAGATVNIIEGTTTPPTILGTVVADTNGIWSFTIPSALSDGDHTFTAEATDVAGNTATSTGLTITVDTALPIATSALDTTSDSGANTADNITNIVAPTINGTTDFGATVQVGILVAGVTTVLGSTIADDITGAWVFTVPTVDSAGNVFNLAQGDNTFSIVSTDIAGNVGNSTQLITLDTVVAPTTFALDAASDTGLVGDGKTNNLNPTITGTTEAGATISIANSAGTNLGNATVAADGTWTFTIPAAFALNEGENGLTITSVDVAGNQSVDSSQSIVLDTIAAPTVFDLDTDVANDTGIAGDRITNNPLTTITGTTEANTVIEVSAGGAVLGNATFGADGTTWSYTFIAGDLVEGVNTLSIKSTDEAGNIKTDATQNISLDTIAPNPADITISGGGTTVVYSAGGTKTVEGTGDIGDTVKITVEDANTGVVLATLGTTEVTSKNSAGFWTLSFDANTNLTVGTNFKIVSTVTDVAGNQTTSKEDLTVIDAVGSPGLTLDATSDSKPENIGNNPTEFTSFATDAITKDTAPIYNISITANANDTTILLFRGDSLVPFHQLTILAGDTTATYTDTLNANGTQSIQAQSIVLSENSERTELIFTADQTAATPIITNSGTGLLLDTDQITITGTGEAGNYVYVDAVSKDGIVASNYSSKLSLITKVQADNTWSLTMLKTALPGTAGYTVTVTQVDTAGNTATSATKQLTIAGNSIEVVENDNTPAIELTLYDGAAATLSVGAGAGNIATTNGGVTSNQQVSVARIDSIFGADGATVIGHIYTFNAPTNLLADSTIAGGGISHAFTQGGVSYDFNIDIKPPAISTVELGDTAPGSTSITPDATPEIKGVTEAGAKVTVTIVDSAARTIILTTTADATGNWSVTSGTLANGAATVDVVAEDSSGNQATSATLNIDVQNHISPVLPNVVLVSTTGNQDFTNIDNSTSTAIEFSGTGGVAGSTILISLNGFSVLPAGTTVTVVADGSWSATLDSSINVPDGGVRDFEFIQQDDNGNQSNPVTHTLTFDRTDPDEPVITSIVENPDHTFTISGTASDATSGMQKVDVTTAGTDAGSWSASVFTGPAGVWSVTTSALPGSQNFTATSTDKAGNTGSTTTAINELDVEQFLVAGDINLRGDGIAGKTITIINDYGTTSTTDDLTTTTIVDGSGNWSVDVSAAVANASGTVNTYTITQADGVASAEVEYTTV